MIGVAPKICTALRRSSMRLDRIVDGAGADEVDALDLGHVDRHDLAAFGERRQLDHGLRVGAGHHARPGEHFGVRRRGLDHRLADGRGRGVGVGALRGRGLRHRRRLPRRRRDLERHRVVDRAVVEGRAVVLPLQELERQEPRALAAVAPALDRRVERVFQVFRALQAQRILPPARFAQNVGQQPRAGVVEFGDRREVEARLRRVLGDGAAQRIELRGARGGQLAGHAHVPSGRRTRPGRRPDPIVPGWRRALELDDILQRELLERVAIRGPLHEVEQREPGERRAARVLVGLDAVREQCARGFGMAAREQQHRIFQHRAHARVAVRHFDHAPRRRRFDQPEAGDRDPAGHRLGRTPARLRQAPPLPMVGAAAIGALAGRARVRVRPGLSGLLDRQFGKQRHEIRGPVQRMVQPIRAACAPWVERAVPVGSTGPERSPLRR